MFKKTKTFFIYSFSLLYLLSAKVALAEPSSGGGVQLQNPTTFSSIDALLDAILSFIVNIGTPIVTLALVYAGFKFLSARGNATKIQEARTILLYVVIGALLVLGAQALKIVIVGTVNEITP